MPITGLFVYFVFISCFLGALWKPIFGVVGYLAVYLVYNRYIWWGITFREFFVRPSFIASIFLIVGALLHTNELKWSISRREIALYLFLVLIWVASLFSGIEIGDEGWTYLEKMTKLFMFIFFFLRIVNSLSHYKSVIWVLILGGIWITYQAHTVSSGRFSEGRLDSIGGLDFTEANGMAAFLAVAVIFLGMKALAGSWWKTVFYVFALAFMLNAIVMTGSRAIFLGFLIATPYVLIRSPHGYRKKTYLFVIFGMILFFMVTNESFLNRMGTIETGVVHQQDEGAMGRVRYWKASLLMFRDHPFGVGVKNFEKLVSDYDPGNPGRDAHNTYVLCYSEIGMFGIALFIIIVGGAFFQIRRIGVIVKNTSCEKEIIPHSYALGAVLVLYMVGYMMTHSGLYMELTWILLSLPICLENAAKQMLIERGRKNGQVGLGSEKLGQAV